MGDPQSFHSFGNNTAARYGWNALAIQLVFLVFARIGISKRALLALSGVTRHSRHRSRD